MISVREFLRAREGKGRIVDPADGEFAFPEMIRMLARLDEPGPVGLDRLEAVLDDGQTSGRLLGQGLEGFLEPEHLSLEEQPLVSLLGDQIQ